MAAWCLVLGEGKAVGNSGGSTDKPGEKLVWRDLWSPSVSKQEDQGRETESDGNWPS